MVITDLIHNYAVSAGYVFIFLVWVATAFKVYNMISFKRKYGYWEKDED